MVTKVLPPQAVPLPGFQVFRHIWLWGTVYLQTTAVGLLCLYFKSEEPPPHPFRTAQD